MVQPAGVFKVPCAAVRTVKLKHAIVIRADCWNFLKNIPVFDNLTFSIQAKNIYPCVLETIGPDLVAMQNNVVVFSKRAFDVYSLPRVIGSHALKIFDKGLLTVANVWVVLRIGLATYSACSKSI